MDRRHVLSIPCDTPISVDKSGLVIHPGTCTNHIAASPDGLVRLTGTGEFGLVEIKTLRAKGTDHLGCP